LFACERGEDTGKHIYEAALKQDLPMEVRTIIERQYQGVSTHLGGVFSIRRIAVKHFQALDTFDYFCHSRALSSLRDQLFGSPSMGSEG
jgi:hypothetical protein